jgi:hypothetical protein
MSRSPSALPQAEPARRAASGSAGRAAAGAFSVGSALGAALTDRRILGPAEAGLLFLMAIVACVVGIVGALWPRVLAWPVALIAIWSGLAWAVKGVSLRRHKPAGPRVEQLEDAMAVGAHTPQGHARAPDGDGESNAKARDRVVSR